MIFVLQSCEDPTSPQDSDSNLDMMIGQMILVGFRGTDVNSESQIAQDIKSGRVGGVILFDKDVALGYSSRNIESPEQVEKLNSKLQSFAPLHKLLIAVDQEGGKVARLKPEYGFPETVSQEYLGRIDNYDTTTFYGNRTAQTLKNNKFNLNFAPVVDLNVDSNSPAIGALGRSFSANPDVVTKNAKLIIEAQKQHKILSCLKHFPGHGSASSDSHLGFTDITNTWSESEILPYSNLVKTNSVHLIMTAHVFNEKLDPLYPATLSSNIINGILRNQIGFDGVVVSDDMNMKAISEHFGLETAIELAINAGVDILVFGNNLVYDEQIAIKAGAIIKKLVKEGKIPFSRIKQAYRRIYYMKNIM
jgi:beta-N-acetylhexosaminidase